VVYNKQVKGTDFIAFSYQDGPLFDASVLSSLPLPAVAHHARSMIRAVAIDRVSGAFQLGYLRRE
jgi:hypothetical protein